MKSNCYIYFHINPLKNEIFYVGKGTLLNKLSYKKIYSRAYRTSGRSSFWNNIKKKYGFIVNIVDSNLTCEQAFEREKFYIKKIGRRNLKLGPLVNLTDGGDGAINVSLETREKSRQAKLGSKNPNFGKKFSPEIIAKFKLRARGILSDESKKQFSIKFSGKNNPSYGKVPYNKGKINTISEETRKKMSESAKKRCLNKKNSNF